jgi:hypothetical protein
MRYLLPLAAIALVVAVYRRVVARCRENPDRRSWFIIGSLAALGLAALLVPWVLAKLNPPYSESPAGIFVYLGKAAVVGLLGLVGLGTLAGAIASARAEPADPTA